MFGSQRYIALLRDNSHLDGVTEYVEDDTVSNEIKDKRVLAYAPTRYLGILCRSVEVDVHLVLLTISDPFADRYNLGRIYSQSEEYKV